MGWRWLANGVVLLHFGFVAFVILGALAIPRFPRLVWLHLPAVAYAILIQAIGWRCPLTDVEKWLRRLGGETPYAPEFLPYYVWHPLGLGGNEPAIGIGLVALIVAVGARPYLAWRRQA